MGLVSLARSRRLPVARGPSDSPFSTRRLLRSLHLHWRLRDDVRRNRTKSRGLRLLVRAFPSVSPGRSVANHDPSSFCTHAEPPATSGRRLAGGTGTGPPRFSLHTKEAALSLASASEHTRLPSPTTRVRQVLLPGSDRRVLTLPRPPPLVLGADDPKLLYFTGLRYGTNQSAVTYAAPEWSACCGPYSFPEGATTTIAEGSGKGDSSGTASGSAASSTGSKAASTTSDLDTKTMISVALVGLGLVALASLLIGCVAECCPRAVPRPDASSPPAADACAAGNAPNPQTTPSPSSRAGATKVRPLPSIHLGVSSLC